MAQFRNRTPLSALLAGLVALTVVAMVVDRRAVFRAGSELPGWTGSVLDVAVPVQQMIALPLQLTRDAWRSYIAVVRVGEENEVLRSKLALLEDENLQLREALVASGRLQRIAAIREEFEVPMLASELVGVDASAWFRSVLINRGRAHGVQPGMPVISEHGLVGLVTSTSNSASKAMLVLDRQSAVDGIVQRSRSRGIVRGGGTDQLHFEFVVRESDVQIGDVVITSGLGGIHPKGIRIGEVTSVSEPGSDLLQTATLTPAVDFGRLELVFVMLRRGSTMELLYRAEDGAAAGVATSNRTQK